MYWLGYVLHEAILFCCPNFLYLHLVQLSVVLCSVICCLTNEIYHSPFWSGRRLHQERRPRRERLPRKLLPRRRRLSGRRPGRPRPRGPPLRRPRPRRRRPGLPVGRRPPGRPPRGRGGLKPPAARRRKRRWCPRQPPSAPKPAARRPAPGAERPVCTAASTVYRGVPQCTGRVYRVSESGTVRRERPDGPVRTLSCRLTV